MKETYQRDSRSLSVLNWCRMQTFAIMDSFFRVIVYLCSIIWCMKSQRKCLSIAFLLFLVISFCSCFCVAVLRPSWFWSWPSASKTHDEDLELSAFLNWNFRFFLFLSKCTRIRGFCKSYILEKNFFACLFKYTTKTCF